MVELCTLIPYRGEELGITAAEVVLEEKILTDEAVYNIINRLLELVAKTKDKRNSAKYTITKQLSAI